MSSRGAALLALATCLAVQAHAYIEPNDWGACSARACGHAEPAAPGAGWAAPAPSPQQLLDAPGRLPSTTGLAAPAPWQQQQLLDAPGRPSAGSAPDVSRAPPMCTPELIARTGWGVASAAYQVEGAHDAGGKSRSIWDSFVRLPGRIKNGDTGDVACDHYHRAEQDFALMRRLGVKLHRFSIAWTRIVPGGRAGSPVNPAGVDFYNRLIDSMLANGITPVATIYHWDLPQVLQDAYGGFLGDEAFVADFEYYAATLFRLFGDRVRDWITFNEPAMVCEGYGGDKFAPGLGGGARAYFRACHNLLRAHAAAARAYRSGFQAAQRGRVGLTINVVWSEPLTAAPGDVRAAQNKLARDVGWLLDPLTRGDYPSVLKAMLKDRLPAFSAADRRALNGSLDFVGTNVYTARWVFEDPNNPLGFKETAVRDGKPIGSQSNSWLYAYPEALGAVLTHIGLTYNRIPTYVTEFGTNVRGEDALSDEDVLQDSYRIRFYHAYLSHACAAIRQHRLNVPKLFAWTWLDNFEWGRGVHHSLRSRGGGLSQRHARAAAQGVCALVRAQLLQSWQRCRPRRLEARAGPGCCACSSTSRRGTGRAQPSR